MEFSSHSSQLIDRPTSVAPLFSLISNTLMTSHTSALFVILHHYVQPRPFLLYT